MISNYLQLTKPGIIRGNLVAAAGGFFLASQGQIDWQLFLAVCLGTTFIVASGCVFNNFIDKDIDAKMKRTCQRELVQKVVPVSNALIWATILGVAGFVTLFFYTSIVAFWFGVLGFVVYVGFYSLYYKRHSVHGTLIGGLSGACPPVIGYCAVTNQFDVGAAIVFLTFCIWQIPHSYAIAIYRFEDYKAASIPVLPIKEGIDKARTHIMAYIVAFAIASLALTYLGYAGSWYALGMGLVSMYWLYLAKVSFQKMPTEQWGKQLMLFSIVCIMVFCVLISIDFSPSEIHETHQASLNALQLKEFI
ncbi:protoheme IX farnesyltransferase [Vibrio nigripulchritudo MADA3029]|uniref:Protoheme IX farnesyltransferase n=1 Tax=Vibrio nigripulchritudo SOn1 TaxID=1238450 RepID=A0AAV2VRW9_9VIBR|nr:MULTISPECIES: heme o synthase [Vibrio]EGU61171.1 protoheme IX farnesyltransferase [Vibrio nigripulchritudo ATCC 27043]KJY80627.1 protoheme IX farnesyltransferase [Vibrio nigripulchritudo]UAB71483.1 protoheme IX farnesyltransferase [Vibrio sp. SCSIO 43132]CCN49436.1 protoheme IX farnesyltransferase [Vibrio nigripulchritudo MADA3020]CCN53766.1 protoheme IX farnesyltransferase [Vibrio nigripulchritudo MADA3021]